MAKDQRIVESEIVADFVLRKRRKLSWGI